MQSYDYNTNVKPKQYVTFLRDGHGIQNTFCSQFYLRKAAIEKIFLYQNCRWETNIINHKADERYTPYL